MDITIPSRRPNVKYYLLFVIGDGALEGVGGVGGVGGWKEIFPLSLPTLPPLHSLISSPHGIKFFSR